MFMLFHGWKKRFRSCLLSSAQRPEHESGADWAETRTWLTADMGGWLMMPPAQLYCQGYTFITDLWRMDPKNVNLPNMGWDCGNQQSDCLHTEIYLHLCTDLKSSFYYFQIISYGNFFNMQHLAITRSHIMKEHFYCAKASKILTH